MRILFCSNYFTHHQIPLSDALYELTNHNYCFVAHKEMDVERKNLGWGNDLARPYTCSASDQDIQKQLSNLDVLIAGSFPERQIKEYRKKAKLFFRYSERILKQEIRFSNIQNDFSTGTLAIRRGERHICSVPAPILRGIMPNSGFSMIGATNGATFRRRYDIPALMT